MENAQDDNATTNTLGDRLGMLTEALADCIAMTVEVAGKGNLQVLAKEELVASGSRIDEAERLLTTLETQVADLRRQLSGIRNSI